jgi:hypothetical protein
MSFPELRAAVKTFAANPQPSQSFALLKKVTAFVTQVEGSDDAGQAQELVIRLLDVAKHLNGYRSVVDGMVREVGLFPYLETEGLPLADKLAYEFHRPRGITDTVFHRAQAEVYRRLMDGDSVVLSAPTSFGKSLVVDGIVASGIHQNIVIVVPTLALLDETRRRLARFRGRYHIITHASQQPGESNIFVLTQERVIENENIKSVDFFVIDEFYKLNPETDQERAETLNHAFYKLARLAKQFYMLGPNIQAIPDGFRKRYRCTFIATDYATVVTEVHRVSDSGGDDKAVELCGEIDGPTLVYCASPARVRTFGTQLLAASTPRPPSPELREAAEWVRDNFHPDWSFATLLEAGIGLHHGKLPRSIAQLMVRLFNRGLIRTLVCTSTLIEGVNTKAKNVIILDNKLATKKYDYFTFSNIRGRSGRMFEHFIGNVYLFHAPPQQELPLVDIPVFTQTDTATDSLLIQVDADDLSDRSKKRLEPYARQEVLSMATLKANAGIPPEAQIALANALLASPMTYHPQLNWTRYPTGPQLYASCALLWEHFVQGRTRSNVRSGKQLAFLLQKSLTIHTLEEWVALDNGAGSVDTKIDAALDFIRQWPQFRAPKLFGALNRIQHEIFSRLGLHPGNFEFYMGALESLGRPPIVMALEEYGIPLQIGERLWPTIGSPEDLDVALERIREVDLAGMGFTVFETRLLQELQPAL